MPFNLHIPLPGPFSYNKRIGGNKRNRPSIGQQLEQIKQNKQNKAAIRANMERARELQAERAAFKTANPRRYRTNQIILSVFAVLLALIVVAAVL